MAQAAPAAPESDDFEIPGLEDEDRALLVQGSAPAKRSSRQRRRRPPQFLSALHVWGGVLTIIASGSVVYNRSKKVGLRKRSSVFAYVALGGASILNLIGLSIVFNALVYFLSFSQPRIPRYRHSNISQSSARSPASIGAPIWYCYPLCLSRWHTLKCLAALEAGIGSVLSICDVFDPVSPIDTVFDSLLLISAVLLWAGSAHREQVIQWRVITNE